MEHSQRFPALVIRRKNFEEADQFITFLTPGEGKVSALARGVRKFNSKKAGHLQSFNYVDVQLSKGRGSSLIVTQVTTIETFPGIMGSLEKMARASCVLELAEKFSPENAENREIFQLTLDTIRRINFFDDVFPIQRYFDIHLLDLIGYRPQLHQCVNCHKTIQPEDQYFSARMGGVLCPDCGPGTLGARPITMRTLKFLRYYQQRSFQEAMMAGWPEEIRFEGESVLTGYQTYLLEYKTNSQVFLEKL